MRKGRIICFLIPIFFYSLELDAQYDSVYAASDNFISKGIELHNNGEYIKAIDKYSKVCKCDPEYGRACYEMALSYYYIDSIDAALDKCNEAIFLKYNDVAVYSLKGSMLDNSGRSEEGIAILSDALTRWPYNQTILYNLAVCYLNINQPLKAEEILLKSILLNPYHMRTHLGLAKANYMMGRITQSYLAYNMALLLSPSISNISAYEDAIEKKPSLVSQAYKYPYPKNIDSRKWDDLTGLLLSDIAFNDDFDYDYDVSYLITRQSLMLFRKIKFDPADSSLYNQLYVRLFSTIYQNDDFEVYLNYLLKNTNNSKVADWINKNSDKLNKFVSWAQTFLNEGRSYGFSYASEKQGKKKYQFNDKGDLTAIGITENNHGNIKQGDWINLRVDGSVSERGKYLNDKSEGEWLVLWPNGKIKRRLSYKNDKLDGKSYYYFPNGSIQDTIDYVSDDINGKLNRYTPSGFLVLVNNYSNGKANGPGLYNNYEQGYTRKFNYSNDELVDSLTETWFNGKPKFSAFYQDEVRQGKQRSWYSNGSRESEMNYVNDTLVGEYLDYFPNNKIKYQRTLDTNGKLTGKFISYDRYGNEIAFDSNYVDGLLEGIRIEYFPDGKKQNVLTYVNDRLTELKCYDKTGKILYSTKESDSSIYYKLFYDNGVLNIEGLIEKGKKQGTWKTYNAIGIITKKSEFDDNLMSGKQLTYYANGNTKEEYVCDSDQIVGEYKEFYIDGKLKSWGYYDKKGQSGKWMEFYSNDTLKSLSYYSEGKMAGTYILYHPDGKIESETFYNGEGTPVRTINYNPDGSTSIDMNYEYGTYQFEEKYPSGQIKEKYNISDNYLHGLRESYYPNGQLLYKAVYYHNFLNGLALNWDYKGNKTLETTYSMNLPEGDVKWYRNSKIDYFATYELGMTQDTLVDYYDNGNVSRKMSVMDDNRQGNTFYYAPDGMLMFRLRFDNNVICAYSYLGKDGKFIPEIPVTDTITEIVTYYPNGRISARFRLSHGLYNGKFITYYANGTKLKEATYANDENEGYETLFYPNNMLKEKVSYHADNREGIYQSYYDNGKIHKTGNYFMNNEEGDWKVFNREGSLKEILTYHDGVLYEIKKK